MGNRLRPDINAPLPQPHEFNRFTIPDTMAGIRFEVERMKKMVREFAGHPDIVQVARAIVAHVPAKDKLAEMQAIHAFLTRTFRYIHDPPGREVLATPVFLIRQLRQPDEIIKAVLLKKQELGIASFDHNFRMSEDCDGAATLSATLLAGAGIISRFRLGGETLFAGNSSQCNFHHVWAQGLTQHGWIDMDITEPNQPLGWFFPAFGCYGTVEIFD
jgi:transglutaminase-like putative cysteine protease